MTPASSVLHYLINNDEKAGMVVVQPESELAAMCMVVGASYAGVRAMTATSGGGFCLMVEALGLAGMTEIPVVVMLGQRPGPSTGMATYTSQSDLLFSINAGQGEFPRVVVAPGDVDQCFYQIMNAFNLAERFQVPVLVLTDKHLLESHKTTKPWDVNMVPVDRGKLFMNKVWEEETAYERYKLTKDGVSPRLIPGTLNALKLSNSNEHDEYGFTSIDPGQVVNMVNKRMNKFSHIVEAVHKLNPVRFFGSDVPDVSMFIWGSTKGPALEALGLLDKEGIKGRVVQSLFLEPFPESGLEPFLQDRGAKIILESNRTGQLAKLIKLHNGFSFKNILLKFDGRQFFPEEIRDKVLEVLK
jgi:2-oxoglutarate ferredoxin oxidoreductase subunit alpha